MSRSNLATMSGSNLKGCMMLIRTSIRVAATAAALTAGTLIAVPAIASATPPPAAVVSEESNPGMERMDELMTEGNPGMERMHELMTERNPGMTRMHELMATPTDTAGRN